MSVWNEEEDTVRGGGLLSPQRPSAAVGGFVFAFKRYTEAADSLVGKLVEWAASRFTHSDFIHVEMIPVLGRAHGRLLLAPQSFTALMKIGFFRNDSRACMADDFTLVYLPLTPDETSRGCGYLQGVVGTGYNYVDLVPAVAMSEERKCEDIAAEQEDFGHFPHGIFCSQAGLLLCKALAKYNGALPARYCTPVELKNVLRQMGCKEVPKAETAVVLVSRRPFDAMLTPPLPLAGHEGSMLAMQA